MSKSNILKLLRDSLLSCSYLSCSYFGLLSFVILASVLLTSPQNACAVDVILAWDANSEADLAGYRIFYREDGQSYNYDNPAWEGTDTTSTIYNLDDNTIYHFVARAFDDAGNESGNSDEVSYAPSGNIAPTAHAGPDQTISEGSTVILDGSNSTDPDGNIASYLWTQTSGTSVALSDPTASQPTFTAPAVGGGGEILTFQLEVTDDGGLTDADTVTVNVSNANQAPVALAGADQMVNEGDHVNLDGSNSYDPEGTISSYSWSQIAGPDVTLSDPLTSQPTFTAPDVEEDGAMLTFQLTVMDNGALESTDTCIVHIVDIPESNLPPTAPVISSPYDGQMECGLMPNITTEPFSDPDGDAHGQSQWQIGKANDFDPAIFNVTSTDELTEITVPHLLLEADTTYYVRVRFYDMYLEPSDWSGTIEFTTATNNYDINSDGIPDDQEVGYGVDLNGNGVDDIDEPENIKCVQSADGAYTIGVSKVSDSIIAIEAVEIIDPSSISDNTNRPSDLPFGLFSYRIAVNEIGATATVRIYFSEPILSSTTFYKYDTINGWQDYSQRTTFNGDGRSIDLELKDGGYGDSDGQANAIIVDPGGLGIAGSSDIASVGDDLEVGFGCFITTAACNAYTEPETTILTSILMLAGLMSSYMLFRRRN